MDVTCDRCKTGYEFDDALVSERGTSVRCTQCGHTFKVRRTTAAATSAAGKEKWLVRTIDGRELEFRALRELQAAIGKGLVRRDDVLARENGRPRRLGSIAELDPFFSARTLTHAQQGTFQKTSIGVGPPRARSHTPPGLGDGVAEGAPVAAARSGGMFDSAPRAPFSSSTTEHSVAIPLAAAVAKHQSDPPRGRAGSRPSLASGAGVSPLPGPRPPANSVSFEGSGPPEDEDVTHPVSRKQLEAAIRAAESQASNESVARALPLPSSPPPRPSAEDATVVARLEDVAKLQELERADAPVSSGGSSGVSSGASSGAAAPSSNGHGPEMLPPPPTSGGTPAPRPVRGPAPTLPDATRPDPTRPEAPAAPTAEGGVMTPTPDTPGDRGSLVDMRPSAMSLMNLTPTPADVRYSYVEGHTRSSDGRFSAVESRRVGSARWIFALLLVGAFVVGGAVVARRYLATDPQRGPVAGQDERLTGLLAQAEAALATGDLELAKEQVDIASGLAERDPRVAELAARIANERAELPWLELRFLAAEDPSRPAVKQRLAERVGRARANAGRAAELAPSSATVVRERIDALRLAGDLAAARALVPQVASGASDARTQLVLAALDLAEEAPPFPTLLPRLSKAATEEGAGGRARLLLVYALGRSGDVGRARTELARLRATHPLRDAATAFLERTKEGVPPALDIESLPDATTASPDGGEGEIPADFRRALEQATQSAAKGDYARADRLYRAALQKEPGNAEALCGLGHVARARGDAPGAIASYRKSLDAAPGYLPALVPLADLLWDAGDRGAAQSYYRRIVQLAPSGPAAERARERSGAVEPAAPPEPTAAPPEPGTPPGNGEPGTAPDDPEAPIYPDGAPAPGAPPGDPPPPAPPGDAPPPGDGAAP